jgi:PleD family two-component response regulator
MDHSYRTVNGNIADSPPSTIELRNGNVNGNGHSHSYANEAFSSYDAPPTPVRDDAPTRIYCFIEDLFFLAKIQETARKLGIKVSFVKAEKDIVAKLAEGSDQERPSLIVFDLNNANAKPLTLIPKIRTKLKKGKTSIIGFLSHIQGDLKVKAVEAGCDMVMPRSAFSQNLPNLLRRHGLDEEEELETVQVQ